MSLLVTVASALAFTQVSATMKLVPLFYFLLHFIMGNVNSVWKIPFFEIPSQVPSTHG